jgi:import inner membrane translocase subunit TIM50
LAYLNRDLSKVIVLDAHAEHVRTHPNNAIVMPKWTGTPGDKGLIAMIPFLECESFIPDSTHIDRCAHALLTAIGIYKPADVRPIVGAYAGKDVPLEYAKFEAAAKQKHIEEWEAKRAAGGGKGLGSGAFTLSTLFAGSGVRGFPFHP